MLARYARCALPMPPDPVGRHERSRARPPAHLGLTALLGFGSILHLPAIGWSMALIVVAWMMTYVRALGRHSA